MALLIAVSATEVSRAVFVEVVKMGFPVGEIKKNLFPIPYPVVCPALESPVYV